MSSCLRLRMQVQTTVNTCNDGPGLVVLLCGDGLIGLIGPLNFSRGLLDPAGTVCTSICSEVHWSV